MATAAQREKAAAGIVPRLLSRLQAAVYVGMSATEFDLWAKEHGLRPLRRGRRALWDMRRLDLVIDRLFDPLDTEDAGGDVWSVKAL